MVITLQLHVNEVSAVLQALAKQPYEAVHQLIGNIQASANEQLQAANQAQPAPAAEPAPKGKGK